MFWRSLLWLAFVVIVFTACATLFTNFGISLTYVVVCSRMVTNMMTTAISACRGSVMCGVLSS